MIAILMALAVQQAAAPPADVSASPRPADLPALVTAEVADCVAAQIALDADPQIHPASPLRQTEALDGSDIEGRVTRGYCQFLGRWWRGDGDVMARAVQTGLKDLPPPVVVARWRDPMVNERGSSVWTTFERKDDTGRTIAIVRLIEPADGATGEVDIAWETPPP